MSSTEVKKKRKLVHKKPTPQSTPNPSLPDDLVLTIVALVSRLFYPTLSLVSKSFRSLIPSPVLYQTRSLLGHTESCLYVVLRFPPDPNPRWFTLCRKPNQVLTDDTIKKKKKKKPSGYVLATIPMPHSPSTNSKGLVAIGSDIYNIGGSLDTSPSASVSILDCRSHTWGDGPSLHGVRNDPVANVLDEKIYVVDGGCKFYSSSNRMEIFDPKTQTWELVSSSGAKLPCFHVNNVAGVDGKVYILGENCLVYNPKDGRWNILGYYEMNLGWKWSLSQFFVIENVLYSYYYYREFQWYDTKVRVWRDLMGLKGLPQFARHAHVKFVDYGGKMAVIWDKDSPLSGYKNKVIWCAVVAVERRNNEEIWGKVEWCDAVLTVPKSYSFDCALVATV